MKKFFTTTFACVLGVMIATLLLSVFAVVTLVGSIALMDSETTQPLKKNTILHLKMEGEIVERTTEDPWSLLFASNETPTIGLDNLIAAVQRAATDDNVVGIYMDMGMMNGGYASIDALRNELLAFKESGKFIVAYADYYMQKAYYLASVADTLIVNPVGMIDFRGISSNPIFYTRTLEKLGIEVQVFKVGTFKSAVEPFINTKMSEANREQTEGYISSIWYHLLEGIGDSRFITPGQLNEYANEMITLQPVEDCIRYGLASKLMYRTEVIEMLCSMVGETDIDDLELASATDVATAPTDKEKVESENEIAVLYAVGGIDSENSYSEGINSTKLVEELTKLTKDEDVKGVVLRVNSPGGSAFGSEQIWKAVTDLKAVKPIAVSMGDYAASGGYYIACPANRIFAHATTLTGSIGIFGMITNMNKLFTQKMGLSFDEVKTNKYSNFPTINRAMTSNEKALMQASVERGYDLFLKRCSEGREMPLPQLAAIAEGRVWSGEMALQRGLVDEIGSLQDAIAWVANEADVSTDYTTESYPAKKTTLEILLEQMGQTSAMQLLQKAMGNTSFQYVEQVQQLLQQDAIQARMEYIEL